MRNTVIKKFAMSPPVLPVNEVDVLNTTKYNFNHLNTVILNVTLLMCAPRILQFCSTDNNYDNYVQVISYYIHVTVILGQNPPGQNPSDKTPRTIHRLLIYKNTPNTNHHGKTTVRTAVIVYLTPNFCFT